MEPIIEKIAIIGAGALGAVYGSIFYETDPNSVFFISNGERYDALKQNGVIVNGKRFAIPAVKSEDCVPVGLIIVAVKHHQLDDAISDMRMAVGKQTIILSVMNGIDSEERIGAVYGMDKVVYGLTLGIDAVRENHSVNYSNLGRILFGEKDNTNLTDRVRRISEQFNKAGITYAVPQDMIRSLWYKFMINVGANQASAVKRATYGSLRSSSESKQLMDSAMREVISIAKRMKVDLSEDDIVEWYKVLDTLGADKKTSMLQDVDAGRQTEVDMLAGTVIKLGKQHGVTTPVNQQLFDELKRIEGASGKKVSAF
jgi:2-dehydropantoate 2-reductase